MDYWNLFWLCNYSYRTGLIDRKEYERKWRTIQALNALIDDK
jgi:hypothetical protein